MVIADNEIPNKSSCSNDGPKSKVLMASPLDRLASFIIDHLIILGPIINLFISPFERQMKEAILIGDDPQMILNLSNAVLMGLSILLIYHTVFLRLVGGSLGQILVGLRVVAAETQGHLSVWNSALRAGLWLINFLLLGLPTLAVFSDDRRRTWYDRVSNSIVVTSSAKRAISTPKVFHRSMVQGFFASLFVAGLIVVSFFFNKEIRDFDRKSRIYAMLEEEDVLCGVVGEAQAEWPEQNGKSENRISVALALYFAGEIDLSCLEAEFDERTFASQQDDLARLAKSFVYQDHSELSDLYLNAVCDVSPVSAACQVATSILEPFTFSFTDAVSNDSPVYLSVWGLQRELDRGDYAGSRILLERLPQLPWTSGIRSVASARIQWGQGQYDMARGSTLIAFEYLKGADRFELAAWMCLSELKRDCEAWDSFSCAEFQEVAKMNSSLLGTVTASLAQVKKRKCEDGDGSNIDSLATVNIHSDVKALLQAASVQDREEILSIASDTDLNPNIRLEAITMLLDNDPRAIEISFAEEVYSLRTLPLADSYLAPMIMDWANDDRNFEKVSQIGKREGEHGPILPVKALEHQIVAEFNLGRKIKAQELLGVYQKHYSEFLFKALDQERSPASQDETDSEFSMIVRGLK